MIKAVRFISASSLLLAAIFFCPFNLYANSLDNEDAKIELAPEKLKLHIPAGEDSNSADKPSYDIMKRWSINISGNMKNETAFRMNDPVQFTKIKNQLIMAGTGKFNDNIRFKISGLTYFDAVYYWTRNFCQSVRSDMGADIIWRDTYIDLSWGPFDARLGNQQVVWGEAVALFFADCVNARDLREFILRDFDMIRIPQWGIDLEYSKDNFHAEFVYLPDVEFDRLGVTGSEFFFYPPIPSPMTPFILHDAPDVNSSFPNGNIAGRLSYLYNGLDMSVFYYHTWTKSPVYFRSITSDGVYDFVPEYRRMDIIGATFAKEIKKAVIKGEAVYFNNFYFPVNDAEDSDGIIRRSYLSYLLGVDYTFFDKWETNLQFMQKIIFDYNQAIINELPVDNSFAFRVKTEFFGGKFEPEVTMVTDLMKFDMMIRPLANLKLNKNWKWRFGTDIFMGKWNGLFGQFDKKSRAYSDITCSF